MDFISAKDFRFMFSTRVYFNYIYFESVIINLHSESFVLNAMIFLKILFVYRDVAELSVSPGLVTSDGSTG